MTRLRGSTTTYGARRPIAATPNHAPPSAGALTQALRDYRICLRARLTSRDYDDRVSGGPQMRDLPQVGRGTCRPMYEFRSCVVALRSLHWRDFRLSGHAIART